MGVLRSSEEEVPLPLLPSDLRPILRDLRSKIGLFDLRLRRSKIEDEEVFRSSAPKIEDEGFFDLRLGRTKKGGFRSSASKIEN